MNMIIGTFQIIRMTCEYQWTTHLKYVGDCKQNRSTEADGDDDYSFNQ